MTSFGRFLFPIGDAALRRYAAAPASRVSLPLLTAAPATVSRSQPELLPGRRQLFAFSSEAFRTGVKPTTNVVFPLRLSPPRRGSYLEDYYTNCELATCIQSPWPFYMWGSWAILMAIISIGSVFHSNYYFSGRFLPKVNANTQLCEDSW